MTFDFEGFMWLLLLLGPLLVLQRKVHFEIQAWLLILIRRVDIVTVLFSLLFLPGVFLHELSHFLAARLLGVRTGRFSILPRTKGNGKLQLGYVETAASDVFRDSLIGAAPLITGSIVIILIAQLRLGLNDLELAFNTTFLQVVLRSIQRILSVPDFWIWFYLLFAISSTMLPSASDRRAWLPVALIIGIVGVAGVLVGVGPWMASNLSPALNSALRALSLVLGISVLVHLFLVIPIYLLRLVASKITGLEVR